MTSPLRVAVAGASGIGKHHAKWYDSCGCDVVAFLGSNEKSCRATADSLAELFGFSGRGYTALGDLLHTETPDIVDVCTPNELHFEGARTALEAGCHVLIEKPIVWAQGDWAQGDWAQGDWAKTMCDWSRQLIDLAREKGRHLGVCTQYATALPHYEQICRDEKTAFREPVTFEAMMETLSRGRQRSAEEIWIDMGSHPLSMLLAWLPGGVIDTQTLAVDLSDGEMTATFDFIDQERRCKCDIVVRDREEGPPTRRFGINGVLVDCSGRTNEDGVFQTVLSRQGREKPGQDFMYLLISQFVDTVLGLESEPIASAKIGLRNLELQLQILGAALPAG